MNVSSVSPSPWQSPTTTPAAQEAAPAEEGERGGGQTSVADGLSYGLGGLSAYMPSLRAYKALAASGQLAGVIAGLQRNRQLNAAGFGNSNTNIGAGAEAGFGALGILGTLGNSKGARTLGDVASVGSALGRGFKDISTTNLIARGVANGTVSPQALGGLSAGTSNALTGIGTGLSVLSTLTKNKTIGDVGQVFGAGRQVLSGVKQIGMASQLAQGARAAQAAGQISAKAAETAVRSAGTSTLSAAAGIGGAATAVAGLFVKDPGTKNVLDWTGIGLTAVANPVLGLIGAGVKLLGGLIGGKRGAAGNHAQDMVFSDRSGTFKLTRDNDNDVRVFKGQDQSIALDLDGVRARGSQRGASVADGLAEGQMMGSRNGKYVATVNQGELQVIEVNDRAIAESFDGAREQGRLRGSTVTDALTEGQIMRSKNGRFAATVSNGALQVYALGRRGAQKVYDSGTQGVANAAVQVAGDGKLVLHQTKADGSGSVPLASGGDGVPGKSAPHALTLNNNGELTVTEQTAPGAPPAPPSWSSANSPAWKAAEPELKVVYSSGTQGTEKAVFKPGEDGNLTAYKAAADGPGRSVAVWQSKTGTAGTNKPFKLRLQDDGNLVMVNRQNPAEISWSSKTNPPGEAIEPQWQQIHKFNHKGYFDRPAHQRKDGSIAWGQTKELQIQDINNDGLYDITFDHDGKSKVHAKYVNQGNGTFAKT
jgi:hypothetical protein